MGSFSAPMAPGLHLNKAGSDAGGDAAPQATDLVSCESSPGAARAPPRSVVAAGAPVSGMNTRQVDRDIEGTQLRCLVRVGFGADGVWERCRPGRVRRTLGRR